MQAKIFSIRYQNIFRLNAKQDIFGTTPNLWRIIFSAKWFARTSIAFPSPCHAKLAWIWRRTSSPSWLTAILASSPACCLRTIITLWRRASLKSARKKFGARIKSKLGSCFMIRQHGAAMIYIISSRRMNVLNRRFSFLCGLTDMKKIKSFKKNFCVKQINWNQPAWMSSQLTKTQLSLNKIWFFIWYRTISGCSEHLSF